MSAHEPLATTEVDPFDLPDWLGTTRVTWRAVDSLHAAGHVRGELVSGPAEDSAEEGADTPLACDLLAVDVAHPRPVADDALRRATHLAWAHGQVHLVARGERLTLATPGTGFTADRVLEVVARLALAVGARPTSYAVWLRVGAPGGDPSHLGG